MKKINIVVLHYKGKSLTRECLDSLKKIERNGFQVNFLVVVNNPNEDLTDLEKDFSGVKFLVTGENLGFAEGNNVGLRLALKEKADFVLVLNNDTLVDPKFLVKLLEVAKKEKKAGIFCPKIYFAPGFEFHYDRYKDAERGKVIWFAGGYVDWANIATRHRGVDEVDQGQYDRIEESEFITGCSMLVRKEVFEKVGLFDPQYFLYYEDADFCQRALNKGFRLLYVPEAKIWHKVAASSEIGGDLHDYFLVRNQLLFGWRFAPWRAKWALVKQSLRFLFFGRKWQKIGVRDFYLGKFGLGSWR